MALAVRWAGYPATLLPCCPAALLLDCWTAGLPNYEAAEPGHRWVGALAACMADAGLAGGHATEQ